MIERTKIYYGTATGNDFPIAPKHEVRTDKGNYCTVYVKSELNPDCPTAISRGYKYKITWQSYGGHYSYRDEWDTITSDKRPEDMIDQYFETYGNGIMWITQDEIVTRK